MGSFPKGSVRVEVENEQPRIMDIDGRNNKSLGIQGEMPDWKPGTGIDY